MMPDITSIDFYALSPLAILLLGAVLVLLIETFSFYAKQICVYVAGVTLIAALVATYYAPTTQHPFLTAWIKFDALSRIFSYLFLSIGLATALISEAFFKRFSATHGEYYFLLLSSIFGLILISSAADFLTLFLGLETLSIALYVLCGYMKKWVPSHESSAKYFLIGSIAAAILLYGIALVYGATGTTRFDQLLAGYQATSSAASGEHNLFLIGIGLVTIGLAFKAAIVPFHTWAPDVYQGAPNPVTALMAVGTKAGAFAALIRLFIEALPHFDPLWSRVLTFLAFATLIYANIVAIKQVQLRRFFAYSGISHAGFLLIPLAAGTPDALSALLFYMVVYVIATLGAFAVLAFADHRSDGTLLRDLPGLFRRRPMQAVILALCLLTLAGMPPTVGFLAKFYLFKVAYDAGLYLLVIIALLTTILAAYYYLRIISIMLAESNDEVASPWSFSKAAAAVAIVAFVSLIVLSGNPALLTSALK